MFILSSFLVLSTMFSRAAASPPLLPSLALRPLDTPFHTAVFAADLVPDSVVNNCGYGTPMMNGPSTGLISIPGGYSTGGDMTGWIVYLQTGSCGANGENCLILEGTLNGGYSSVDISRISPHGFNAPLGFSYTNGAGGKECASADCSCNDSAFCSPTDYGAQVGSSDPNAIDLT
ncbi:hypothetical protein HWV62_15695 [Athelia sp. TMB]|nr:hypothetical protein HWV62_15695 [Athelia sp. TMB]